MAGERPIYSTREQMECSQQVSVLGPLSSTAVDMFWDIGHAHRVRVIDEILFGFSAGTTIANAGDFRLLRAKSGRSLTDVVNDAFKVTINGSLATAANRNVKYVVPKDERPITITSIVVSGTNTITVTTPAHGLTTSRNVTLRISGVTGATQGNVDIINNVHNATVASSTTFTLQQPSGAAYSGLTNETETVTSAVAYVVSDAAAPAVNNLVTPGDKIAVAPTEARTRLCLAPNVLWSMQPEYSLTASPQGHNILDVGERLLVDFSGTLTSLANLYITCLYRLRRN